MDVTAAAQELLAFITPKERVFQLMVLPFEVVNVRAVVRGLMIKVLYKLRRRPIVQELIERGAQMQAHIHDI